ncbi:hypothetical protein M3699_23175, partial [Peribacillus simplex]|uniref:hypothetical protein n=1 Tax=Peribacillus simplex TaxID=1478 RepID=UPI00203DF7D8
VMVPSRMLETVPADVSVPAVMVAPSTLVMVPPRMLETVPADVSVPAVMVAPSMLEIVPSKTRFFTFPLVSVAKARAVAVESRPKMRLRRLLGSD